MLRLGRDARSMVKLPRQATNEYPPAPPWAAGIIAGRPGIYGWMCQCPRDYISWGYSGEYFSSSTYSGRPHLRKSLLLGIPGKVFFKFDIQSAPAFNKEFVKKLRLRLLKKVII